MILDFAGVTGLGLYESLQSENRIAFVNTDFSDKYWLKNINCQYYSDINEAYLSVLSLSKQYQRLILLPATDRALALAMLPFPPNVIATNSRFEAEYLLNKELMSSYAQNVGLKIPRSFSKLSEDIPLPAILKPVNSLNYGKDSFRILRTIEDVHKCLSDIPKFEYVIEEFIEGSAENMLEVIGQFSSENDYDFIFIDKLKQSPPEIGSSSLVVTAERRVNIEQKLIRFFSSIEYRGLFDVEFKFCSQRKEYFYIETNFRAGAPIKLITASGVNLANNYANGTSQNEYKIGVVWMNDVTYPLNLGYLKGLIHSDVHAIYSSNNRIRFIRFILRRLLNWILR